MIRQFVPRWPGDRHARPNYTLTSPPVRTTEPAKVLSRYCTHLITVPVRDSAHVDEIFDWIDENESLAGLYYMVPRQYNHDPYQVDVRKMGLMFECERSAVMVKMRWG